MVVLGRFSSSSFRRRKSGRLLLHLVALPVFSSRLPSFCLPQAFLTMNDVMSYGEGSGFLRKNKICFCHIYYVNQGYSHIWVWELSCGLTMSF
jgi:hypothetical protein